ncbi:DUF6904 family protein [Alkalihalobacterium alkalinitrilicum]|uniref:DUF6904 family protein n=1 Tax=Alkalihalobacterium alkalinitrilicum TaxID=427920 RepID=UPI001EE4CEDE|nr:hypothetical protein [Alkalihalobacterium alkalinitrilicum]
MGNREVRFVDNGLDQDKMRYLSIAANDKNIYLVCNVLWPEVLFVTMGLNDFNGKRSENQWPKRRMRKPGQRRKALSIKSS